MTGKTAGAEADLSAVEKLVRQDRLVVMLALVIITLLTWQYLVQMSRSMHEAADVAAMHAAMGMGADAAWSLAHVGMLLVMWSVMMVGMMLPSAAPVILLVVGTYRRRGGATGHLTVASFVSGYLAAWVGFSILATILQVGLQESALLSGSMSANYGWLSGTLFLAAGIYQWLPWKASCLSHCQSPLQFLSAHWREGIAGGFQMGMHHGGYCVGCCWALMLLLFAAGVMNFLWIAAISAYVLLEKILPARTTLSRSAGIVLSGWGLYLLYYS
jgi:predicted metal-binding membrane protein